VSDSDAQPQRVAAHPDHVNPGASGRPAAATFKTHKVSFTEGTTVFTDPFALTLATAQTRLQGENTTKPTLHISEGLPANAAGELQQEVAVDGDDLRDIRHRILRQACGVRG
jgi:hypothetical protein